MFENGTEVTCFVQGGFFSVAVLIAIHGLIAKTLDHGLSV